MRITNDTDDTIEIEPGETIYVNVESDRVRVMASRTKVINIEEVEDK